MLACPLADPTVSVDGSWWDPVGMRATVSHLVRSTAPSSPTRDVIGEPGSYLREGWQTAFIPHYARELPRRGRGGLRVRARVPDPPGQGRRPLRPAAGRRACSSTSSRRTCGCSYVAGLWDRGDRERGPARRQPRPPRDRAPRRGDRPPLHPRLRRALAGPAEPDRAHPARPHLLPAPRQRRPHPGDDRPGRRSARRTTRRFYKP